MKDTETRREHFKNQEKISGKPSENSDSRREW